MLDFDKIEKEVLKFWKQRKIYEKSVKKNASGKAFYFMDGPPYATGHIHMGTALNKILKDIIMRSQRLQGMDVFDRPGYDTHGVPIEFQIEKDIGSKSKNDIEKYGVAKFVAKCKQFATRFIDVMNSEFQNLGVWMDWKKPYLTLEDKYIEAIWQAFKKADQKKLLYLGQYPVHVCPRCETAVAFNEIEYSKQKDTAVFVKFPVKGKKNTFFIIWTTTPWTLPGNTGIMVHPDFEYQEIQVENEKWIIAKELVAGLMKAVGKTGKAVKVYKGKKLEGMDYENPLAENLNLKLKNAYKVITSSRYVNLEEGTGLVHCAPGHGKEDYEVGKKKGIDIICPVMISGELTKEAGKYAGGKARVVDVEIIEDLDKSGMLVNKHTYSHDYPLCWRCKTPLLMVSQPQWFLKISSIQKKLLRDNEKTIWIPSWMKLRMKAWLQGIGDWPVSRKRYWGTPLPIWTCENCDNRVVVGGIKELQKLSKVKKIDLHKPGIDKVKIKCKKCGENLSRIEDVLDVWFDSGVCSWAALGYPSEQKNFKRFWPADINIEGKDQVRGWWNSQMILSEITFGKKPFKDVSVHGMVLDLGKVKMSKSLGNIVAPKDVIEKYGRDYLRYYFAKVSKGEDFAFDEKEFAEIRKIFTFLINVNNFISQTGNKKSKLAVEDKWILSRLNSTTKEITELYNSYKLPEVVQKIENFLVEDLSKTYIKLIRDRADQTGAVLNEIRVSLLKLLAPIAPHLCEHLWQQLKKDKNKLVKEESVHLSQLPRVDARKIDHKLEDDFAAVLDIIEHGLAVRDKAQVGLKWPLAKAQVRAKRKISKPLKDIIARQLNVKKVGIVKSKTTSVKLDTKITPALEAEGYAREISRKVQALRKNAGLVKENKIELVILVDENFQKLIEKQKKLIQQRTNSKKIAIETSKPKKKFKTKSVEKIKNQKVLLFLNKL